MSDCGCGMKFSGGKRSIRKTRRRDKRTRKGKKQTRRVR